MPISGMSQKFMTKKWPKSSSAEKFGLLKDICELMVKTASFYLSPFLHNWSSKLGISRQIFVFSHGNRIEIAQKRWNFATTNHHTAWYILFWHKILTLNFSKQYFRNSRRADRADLVYLTRSPQICSSRGWSNPPPAMTSVKTPKGVHFMFFTWMILRDHSLKIGLSPPNLRNRYSPFGWIIWTTHLRAGEFGLPSFAMITPLFGGLILSTS